MAIEKLVDTAVEEIGAVLLGKEAQVRLALCCLFARGHLLLEDLPGMGKTTLSQALAKVVGLEHNRVQFTSDLLPSDILGVSIFDRDSASFQFHPGPVFTEVLLADEINRTTPKTQSALLEAMAERQVTVEGETRPLPEQFFVIATQNPSHQSGTYPLPESQLDRFFMRISLGYPSAAAERQILIGGDNREALEAVKRIVSLDELHRIQKAANAVHTSEQLLDYVQRLIAYSRESGEFAVGLSPRAGLALLTAAKTWALMAGREHVVPEDVQTVLQAVVAHRLIDGAEALSDGEAQVQRMLNHVDVV